VLSEIQQAAEPLGRWVLMPRPDERFVGRGSRSRARARGRRRRVLTVLGEAMGFTALIGAFPPLRPMWSMTAMFGVLLAGYVLLLIRLRTTGGSRARRHAVTLPDQDVAVLRAASVDEDAVPYPRRVAAR
jgi:hypothetical protein